MKRSTVIKTSNSQAVLLPKSVALPESVKKVDVIKLGNARLISPVGDSWDCWFDAVGVSDDFMCSREQPEQQERVSF